STHAPLRRCAPRRSPRRVGCDRSRGSRDAPPSVARRVAETHGGAEVGPRTSVRRLSLRPELLRAVGDDRSSRRRGRLRGPAGGGAAGGSGGGGAGGGGVGVSTTAALACARRASARAALRRLTISARRFARRAAMSARALAAASARALARSAGVGWLTGAA